MADLTQHDLLPLVRGTVRSLLLASPSYQELDEAQRKRMAASMVRVSHAAAALLHEEMQSDREARKKSRLSKAQSAGGDFSGVAAQRMVSTTRDVLNAVSFPRFVTELINGVFKSMIDSSAQQMNSYVELLNNVASSVDGFADMNFGHDRARAWLVEKFPASFEWSSPPDPSADPADSDPPTLQMKDNGTMPSEEALRTALGLEPDESVPGGDPETLVPFARRALAKSRQQMLSTMVMMGMQRIVVESGKINAEMRFHIDTRSAAQADRGSTFSEQNQIEASGSYGVGPWGVSAKMTNNIGYVSTERSQTTEEMNTDLNLNSSVEINFKSDYLPLNRMASSGQADRIRNNSINPDAETAATTARETRNAASDATRRQSLDSALNPQPARSAAPVSSAPQPASTAPPATRPPNTTPQKGTPPPAGTPPASGSQGSGTQSGATPHPAVQQAGAQTNPNQQPAVV